MVDAYECLDDRRQSEAEDQRPSDLPGHYRAMPSACGSPCTMFTAERPPVRRSSTARAGNGLAVLFRPRRSPRSPTSRWSEGRCGAVATGRIVILAGTHRVPDSSVTTWD
jgi:hypothetical protein